MLLYWTDFVVIRLIIVLHESCHQAVCMVFSYDVLLQVYGAPTPTRTNLTVLPGTTASIRGITGDDGPLLKTEYAGDLREWELSLAAGVPSINTGISEMCASPVLCPTVAYAPAYTIDH